MQERMNCNGDCINSCRCGNVFVTRECTACAPGMTRAAADVMHCFFGTFAPQSVTRGCWLSLLRKAKPRRGQLPGSEVRFGSGTTSSALLIEKNVNVPPVPTSAAPLHPLSDRILLETDTLIAPLYM